MKSSGDHQVRAENRLSSSVANAKRKERCQASENQPSQSLWGIWALPHPSFARALMVGHV